MTDDALYAFIVAYMASNGRYRPFPDKLYELFLKQQGKSAHSSYGRCDRDTLHPRHFRCKKTGMLEDVQMPPEHIFKVVCRAQRTACRTRVFARARH